MQISIPTLQQLDSAAQNFIVPRSTVSPTPLPTSPSTERWELEKPHSSPPYAINLALPMSSTPPPSPSSTSISCPVQPTLPLRRPMPSITSTFTVLRALPKYTTSVTKITSTALISALSSGQNSSSPSSPMTLCASISKSHPTTSANLSLSRNRERKKEGTLK